jgi:hypothetical protein
MANFMVEDKPSSTTRKLLKIYRQMEEEYDIFHVMTWVGLFDVISLRAYLINFTREGSSRIEKVWVSNFGKRIREYVVRMFLKRLLSYNNHDNNIIILEIRTQTNPFPSSKACYSIIIL